MFSLSICFGNTVWAFRFKTEAKAAEMLKIAQTKVDAFSIEDDFGQVASFVVKSIHGVMLEDMKKSREAHIEQMIHNAGMQTDAQRRIQTTPRSPSIVSPGFPGALQR